MFIEVGFDFKLFKFSGSQFELSFDLLRLFLILNDLFLKTVDGLAVALHVEVLKIFYCFHTLQTLKLVLGDFC